ncbi:MAG: hypothetical protein KAS46_05265 [Candidatus Aureabacteria bacterium]|nr:hypothetical protein [Candidatus Auribacterota bacterium]
MDKKKKYSSKILFCTVLFLISVTYAMFMGYFLNVTPSLASESLKTQEEQTVNTNVHEKDLKELQIKTPSPQQEKGAILTESKYNHSLEFYTQEITDFYELIITLLLSVIGVLMAVSFMYVYFSSRHQARELANEALECSESFQIILKNIIDMKFTEFKNSDELMQVLNLEDRIEFLEKTLNARSYDEVKDTDAPHQGRKHLRGQSFPKKRKG